MCARLLLEGCYCLRSADLELVGSDPLPGGDAQLARYLYGRCAPFKHEIRCGIIRLYMYITPTFFGDGFYSALGGPVVLLLLLLGLLINQGGGGVVPPQTRPGRGKRS